MTDRRLIQDNAEHTDLGPATAAHIAEMEDVEAKGQTGFAVDPETLEVIRPGQFGYDSAIAVWVD